MPANDTQHGGSHYKDRGYQHWDFVADAGLNYYEGQATKYLSRWRQKNGKEDLLKAGHFVEKLREVRTSHEWPKKRKLTPEQVGATHRFIEQMPAMEADAIELVVMGRLRRAAELIATMVSLAGAEQAPRQDQ